MALRSQPANSCGAQSKKPTPVLTEKLAALDVRDGLPVSSVRLYSGIFSGNLDSSIFLLHTDF